MKCIVAGSRNNNLLATLDTLLRHWGYRVLVSAHPEQVRDLTEAMHPDLLILDTDYLCAPEGSLGRDIVERIRAKQLPILALTDEGKPLPCPCDLPHQLLSLPLDLFSLFELTQQHLQPIPRKNLRLEMNLPALVYSGKISSISEVLSLSIHGMFVKTGTRVPVREKVKVIFSLMGMKTEVEVKGRVLYIVEPRKENSYMQGAGIEFMEVDTSTRGVLEEFLERRAIGNITDGNKPHPELDQAQLKTHGRQSGPAEKS